LAASSASNPTLVKAVYYLKAAVRHQEFILRKSTHSTFFLAGKGEGFILHKEVDSNTCVTELEIRTVTKTY